jgi:lysophospholipase L1-like esterase
MSFADIQAMRTNKILGKPSSYDTSTGLSSSLISSNVNATRTYDTSFNLKVMRSASNYGWTLLNPSVKQVVFTRVGGSFIIIGSGTNTATAIGLTTNITGRVIEISSSFNSYTELKPALSNATYPAAQNGDTIRVTLNTDNTVLFEIMRVNATSFSTWFTIDMNVVTGATSYNTLKCIGFANTFVDPDNTYTVWGSVGQKTSVNYIANNGRTISKNIENNYLQVQNILSQSQWIGKKWNMMGDSFTARDKYTFMVQKLLGIGSRNNYGISGSSVGYTASSNPMSRRYNTMDTTADLITIWAGVNDFILNVPLGVMGDTTDATFYGALDVLLKGIIGMYPTKKIAYIIPTRMNDANNIGYKDGLKPNTAGFTLAQYCQAIREMCELYSIPYLDLYKYGGINELTVSQLTEDGLHPNYLGFQYLAPKVAHFLNSI